ncbi:MAG: hypothetical protein CMJ86_00420 [Planctomycetes bacterium]|nr:hypothetical protein [Planctomycetota bacterium]
MGVGQLALISSVSIPIWGKLGSCGKMAACVASRVFSQASKIMAQTSPEPLVTLRLTGLVQSLEEGDSELLARAARRLGIGELDLRGARIARRSVDARRRPPRLPVQVDLVVRAGFQSRALAREERSGYLRPAPIPGSLMPDKHAGPIGRGHIVVVGSGPAGVFAALPLALGGASVTVLERGAVLEDRHRRLVPFHRGRALDPETNLLFGEGGAGTYSDGKLYTRIDDPLEVPILEELVACGAPAEIRFDARAHIGTEGLHALLPRLRQRLIDAGVTFAFDTRFEGLELDEGPPRRVTGVRTSQGPLACDGLILATGHSARDTWRILAGQGVPFEAKAFQFGVRIEHPQEMITSARYGSEAELLGPASYSLTCKGSGQTQSVHSFCMCPGGRVVASVNEERTLCTNGMSNATHSSPWANSGLVVTVNPDQFAGAADDPFRGTNFQHEQERAAFEAGGGTYAAPAQRADDFLAGRLSSGELKTSLVFGAQAARLDELLPGFVTLALRQALKRFEAQIPGYSGSDGLLLGVESRSSGPIRIPRDSETRLVRGFSNLQAVGEGAGWAGGIMSAAIDGAGAAQCLYSLGNS